MGENQNIIECELCVIGLGVSGLNALHSASQYLKPDHQVLVVERREATKAVGGMWNTTYPFVRLHQPHPLFTVGNRKWRLNKNASYLARREEIVQHFQECYKDLKRQLNIEERFGYEYVGHEEVKNGDGYEVQVKFASTEDPKHTILVKAKRCIKAFGFNVLTNKLMKFSTDKVRSIVPESPELMTSEVADGDEPIYIVGGGKTSLDVATLLLKQNPKSKINFIVGRGTYFINRDIFFPAGMRKYWQGTTVNEFLLDVSLRYNETDLKSGTEYIRKTYGAGPFEQATQNLLGILSPEESTFVKAGIEDAVYDYLEDVFEDNNQLFIRYRSGKTQEVPAGSWFINCTGHIFTEQEASEPAVSPKGTVLSINKTRSTLAFSSMGGYFLTHLWFRDKLKTVPIYELNHNELIKKNKPALLFGMSAQIIHNTIAIFEALPLRIIFECGLSPDKWYPLHRQLPVILKILLNKNKYRKQTAEVLESICSVNNVEGGLIK